MLYSASGSSFTENTIILVFYEFMDVTVVFLEVLQMIPSYLVPFSSVPIALVGYLRLAVNILFSSRPPPFLSVPPYPTSL